MLNMIKKAWNWVWGKTKDLFTDLVTNVITTVEDALKDKELVALAFEAIRQCALQGLTGESAFAEAKAKLIKAAKEAGIEIKDSVVNLIIELVYNSWKNMGFPTEWNGVITSIDVVKAMTKLETCVKNKEVAKTETQLKATPKAKKNTSKKTKSTKKTK